MNPSPEPQSVASAEPSHAPEAPTVGAAPAKGGTLPGSPTSAAAGPRTLVKRRFGPGVHRRRPSVRPVDVVGTVAKAPKVERPASQPSAGHSLHIPEDEKESFFKRYGAGLVIAVLALAAAGYFVFRTPGPSAPTPKQERMVMVTLPPLPPPPPKPLPPPPPPQKQEEKMEKETAPEDKPVAKPDPVKAPDDPAPLGTNIKGDGASGLASGSGGGGGTLVGGGGGGGSRFGWYAGQVQSKITEALRSNPKTKHATMRIEVRIWPDSTGRIMRAQLSGSTGDAGLDSAIQNNVLTGLQLQEPPPTGMRLPIVLRLTARRP